MRPQPVSWAAADVRDRQAYRHRLAGNTSAFAEGCAPPRRLCGLALLRRLARRLLRGRFQATRGARGGDGLAHSRVSRSRRVILCVTSASSGISASSDGEGGERVERGHRARAGQRTHCRLPLHRQSTATERRIRSVARSEARRAQHVHVGAHPPSAPPARRGHGLRLDVVLRAGWRATKPTKSSVAPTPTAPTGICR